MMRATIRLSGSSLTITGTVDRTTVSELHRAYRKLGRMRVASIDVAAVDRIDSAGVAFLDEIRSGSGDPPAIVGAKEAVQGLIDLLDTGSVPARPEVAREPWLGRLGGVLIDGWQAAAAQLRLSSAIMFWSLAAPLDRRSRRRGAIAAQCRTIGSSAVPIVGFLSLIIGVIVVLQAVLQLRQFGADIFVVDLLALSVSREMGPLITAIVVAGRSGSAIAAQIATMKVTEELDALTVMALDPVRYVMVPMLIGMLISIPLLTALSIMVGIVGGMVVSAITVGLAFETFIARLTDVLGFIDLFIGIGKSFFFGAAIVFTACYCGMRSHGGSEGVGRATTQSVVASIFAVIALDAVFSLFYLI